MRGWSMGLHSLTLDDISWDVIWRRRATVQPPPRQSTRAARRRAPVRRASVRMFGYGLLAVVLVLYLDALGLSGGEIGLLLTLTLLGDAAISLWLTTHADRLGRRRVLARRRGAGARRRARLRGHARVRRAARRGDDRRHQPERQRGRAVPGGRAGLARQLTTRRRRTGLFARYQLVGSLATAAGARRRARRRRRWRARSRRRSTRIGW